MMSLRMLIASAIAEYTTAPMPIRMPGIVACSPASLSVIPSDSEIGWLTYLNPLSITREKTNTASRMGTARLAIASVTTLFPLLLPLLMPAPMRSRSCP